MSIGGWDIRWAYGGYRNVLGCMGLTYPHVGCIVCTVARRDGPQKNFTTELDGLGKRANMMVKEKGLKGPRKKDHKEA